jgi:cellulose biosynthesis protein BcsQ
MKTIAFVNSKGGTGKSTLAAAVGGAAEASGEKVQVGLLGLRRCNGTTF